MQNIHVKRYSHPKAVGYQADQDNLRRAARNLRQFLEAESTGRGQGDGP